MKKKTTFLQLLLSNIKTQHHYFDTSHGKSPCDGLGAVVKNVCWNAVKSGKVVIANAEDLYRYCKNKLEHDSICKKLHFQETYDLC